MLCALGLSVSLTALVLVFAFVARNGVFAPDVLDYLGYLAIPTWLAACGASALIVRLASQGMLFRNSFCTNSICTPSRACVMTGQYSHRNGVYDLYDTLPGDRCRLSREMQQAGYQSTEYVPNGVAIPPQVADRQSARLALAEARWGGLLLQAAEEIHGGGSLFAGPDTFPNQQNLEFPLDSGARRYFRFGPPFLQRFLPFWTANLIDRVKIMVIPLLALLIPLIKVMPPTYRWQVRKKIYRWYSELQALDFEHPEALPAETISASVQKLDDIEEEVRKVKVPLSYSDELYNLRLHIDMVRNKLGQD